MAGSSFRIQTGQIKGAPVGFSWTVLFCGCFPALIRDDLKWAVILFLLGMVTSGLSNIVFGSLYNKIYLKSLIRAGFKPKKAKYGTIEQLSEDLGLPIPEQQRE